MKNEPYKTYLTEEELPKSWYNVRVDMQRLMEAKAVRQTEVFEAAQFFARTEGILPAPESSHAIRGAIDEALACKETGRAETILFGLTGTGYFDLTAYQSFNDGRMQDFLPTDEELARSFATLPKVG